MPGHFGRNAALWTAAWLCSASAAEARFLQTDPVGYKDQVNLYTYVDNDPVNKTDPTGLYICEGSSGNCTAFAASLQRGRDALVNGNLSKADRSAISGVLKTYGKEGVRNGVGVTFRSTAQIRAVTSGAAYTQYFPKNGVSLVVLPDSYSKMYNGFVAQEKSLGTSDSMLRGFSPRDERANIAFHEGRHAQDQQNGRPVTEPPAYRTGEAINRAYGSRSVREISNEKTGEDEHEY